MPTVATTRLFREAVDAILSVPDNVELQQACLVGLKQGFASRREVKLSGPATAALRSALNHDHQDIADAAKFLVVAMKIESAGERSDRLRATATRLADVQLPVDQRIIAVQELAEEQEAGSARLLLASFDKGTLAIRAAILEAVFAHGENLPLILAAIESDQLPASALSAVQRELFSTHGDEAIRSKANSLFARNDRVDDETAAKFLQALKSDRDLANGEVIFKKLCSNCHRVRGIGFAVGPDLVSEFARSEETFVQDILVPAAKITAGFETFIVQTVDGAVITGLMSSESPTSITLRKEEGQEQTVLRKDIEAIRVSEASLMPADLVTTIKPQDVADVIAWLRANDESSSDESCNDQSPGGE